MNYRTTVPSYAKETFHSDPKWDSYVNRPKAESDVPDGADYSRETDATWAQELNRCSDPNDEYVKSLVEDTFPKGYMTRKGWIDLFSRKGNRLFLTLAFHYCYTEQQVLGAVKFFIKALNKALWRRSFGTESSFFVRGYAAVEPHVISPKKRGYLHTHLVLDYQPQMANLITMTKAVLDAASHVKSGKSHMLAFDGIDLRPVYDPRGLAVYLTKCFVTRQWANGDNLFFIDREGPLGLVLPSRNMMDY